MNLRERSFLNYDVWGYISERFKISPKKKFDLFFYSLILIAFFLDYFLIYSTLVFFSYTLIFAISIMLNEKKFYEIKEERLWEFLVGIFIIISSFTIVTPIKWYFAPHTRIFGVVNGGIFIIGYFIVFYGCKRYKTVLPFHLFYGILIIIHGMGNLIIGDFAERYISPISSILTYSFLNWLGYSVSISGTTITIVTQKGNLISATVAGACSGIQGMTLSTIMLTGLFIGSKVKYKWRVFTIIIAVFIVFFINIFRLSLIFISAYYWNYRGFDIGHKWFGTILFLTFIIFYWYMIDRKFNKLGE